MAPSSRTKAKRWSNRVTETSNAMTLEGDVFNKSTPLEVAQSLKRSAERKLVLTKAKDELRKLYGTVCFANCAVLMPELTAQGTKVRVMKAEPPANCGTCQRE